MYRLVRVLGSVAALTLSATAAAIGSLSAYPWLSTEFAPAEATKVFLSCYRGDWSPCLPVGGEIQLDLPAGGPFSIDDEFLAFSGELVNEVSGNVWSIGLRAPTLVVKKDFGLGSDEIRLLNIFVAVGGEASLATPPGHAGVVRLAFGSDLTVVPELGSDLVQSSFEIVSGGARSERIDREHTAVVDFLAEDIVSTRGGFASHFFASYESATGTRRVSNYSPCTEDVSTPSIEACEITLEIWAPDTEHPHKKQKDRHD